MAKILVVDDEISVRKMLKEILELDRHEIVEAENGEDALEKMKEHQIDLVLTDLVMPKKNGIDVIMHFKDNYPNVAIVAVSGGGGISGRFDYLPIAQLVGAKAIISKPFEPSQLRSVVSEMLAA
ncbi:MAG: response regulator [Gammaproteobacteria bacterium]|nr:response regulator [Gammaproteobacteria bacterium]MDH5730108.1 response regulator [Gammaproteobacteria bacterium]